MKWFTMFACVAGMLLPLPGQAQTATGTLDRIKASGRVVLGVREASPPMAYALGAQERYVGYHVELCERVLAEIVPQAQRVYMALTAQNTLPLVQNSTVDIGCGPTTHNETRAKQVSFALTTYISQVRTAVPAASKVTSLADLAGKTIVASTGTTAVQLLRKAQRAKNLDFTVVMGKDHLESLLLLDSGRAEAFVLDDNLLAGLIAASPNPKGYRIVGEALGSEPIALLFRRNDPAFKTAVDDVLRRLMQTGEMEKIYARWFIAPIPPRNVPIHLPLSPALREAFANPNDRPLESYASSID